MKHVAKKGWTWLGHVLEVDHNSHLGIVCTWAPENKRNAVNRARHRGEQWKETKKVGRWRGSLEPTLATLKKLLTLLNSFSRPKNNHDESEWKSKRTIFFTIEMWNGSCLFSCLFVFGFEKTGMAFITAKRTYDLICLYSLTFLIPDLSIKLLKNVTLFYIN